MKEQIKELRVRIDGLSQLVKELKSEKEIVVGYSTDTPPRIADYVMFKQVNSKEIEKAYDSLILAKAWLGKMLGELGTESPYKAGYKTVEDIEPTADVYELKLATTQVGEISINYPEYSFLLSMNHIEKVDWLRQEIESLIKSINKLDFLDDKLYIENVGVLVIARTNVYTHLCEARFWLGFELQRIKENNK
jgi:hypothetical protein